MWLIDLSDLLSKSIHSLLTGYIQLLVALQSILFYKTFVYALFIPLYEECIDTLHTKSAWVYRRVYEECIDFVTTVCIICEIDIISIVVYCWLTTIKS